jgi:hypothetical protein
MAHERSPGEAADPDPISIGITRRVKSDQVEAFEAWLVHGQGRVGTHQRLTRGPGKYENPGGGTTFRRRDIGHARRRRAGSQVHRGFRQARWGWSCAETSNIAVGGGLWRRDWT